MAGPRLCLVSMVSKLLADPGRQNGRAGREPPGLACHASMGPVPSGVWSRFVHPSAPPALNTFLYQGGMERMRPSPSKHDMTSNNDMPSNHDMPLADMIIVLQ